MFNFIKKRKKLPERSITDIKNVCRVLFIDDEKFKVVGRLKDKDGWKNTNWIKDVDSISQTEILDAHILFVDVQGVGKAMGFKDEGLGLIAALKKHYPNKKVIMYSGESKGHVDTFHEAANLVDARLRKTADHYEFETTLERLAKDAFCLENCIIRIKSTLYNEYGISMSEAEIETNITKVYNKSITENNISKIFNIQNAAAIANILQLYFSITKP